MAKNQHDGTLRLAANPQSAATVGRVTWLKGDERPGPRQVIGVLELRADDECRAVFSERTQVDGRCHVLLARKAWGGKESRDTRWWSLVLDDAQKVHTIRNGSCGDPILTVDVPRIVRALSELELLAKETMIAVDDGPAVFPCLRRKDPRLRTSNDRMRPKRAAPPNRKRGARGSDTRS